MSKEVEQELEEVSLFDPEGKIIEAVEDPIVPESAPVEEAPAFEMPEKFAGKSMEDVVNSYVNLEKEFGNKSNEVGELRKLTDQILLNQAAQPQHPAVDADINDAVGFNDFVDDPSLAVNRVLDSNPRLKKLEAEFEANAQTVSREALLSAHEDADEVVASVEFNKWLDESPVRKRMIQEAHVNRDVAAASEMLHMFKSTRKAATDNAIDERDAIAKGDLKKASTVKGSAPSKTKKIYKRVDLIRMKVEQPREYEKRRAEFNLAYQEKRVK